MPSVINSTQLRIRFFLKIATLLFYAKFIKGIDLMPICFHRPREDQIKRYAQGRTEPGDIVTYIDGINKTSKHEKWRAFDFVIVINGELIWVHIPQHDRLGAFWKKLGGKWGGDFLKPDGKSMGDYGHFED